MEFLQGLEGLFVATMFVLLGVLNHYLNKKDKELEQLIIEMNKELTTLQLRLRDLERRKYPYQNISKSTVEDLKATIKAARDNGE